MRRLIMLTALVGVTSCHRDPVQGVADSAPMDAMTEAAMNPPRPEGGIDIPAESGVDDPVDTGAERPPDTGPDAARDSGTDGPMVDPRPDAAPGACVPAPEACDGVDNDCDGVVDEDTPEVPICCRGDEQMPPCNGCPAGLTAPLGWSCIPPGVFTIGSGGREAGRGIDETQHQVTITRPFLLMTTEVTQAQWGAIFPIDPSLWAVCPECPVNGVNWWESVAYANALSRAARLPECYALENCEGDPGDNMICDNLPRFAGLDCLGYRLSTEAEWEYATRAGTQTRFWSGDEDGDLDGVAVYTDPANVPADPQPLPVASLAANPWGLFDVHGNVMEWTHDLYQPYAMDPLADPLGPPNAAQRTMRGGHFNAFPEDVRSAVRVRYRPEQSSLQNGFRVARTVVAP